MKAVLINAFGQPSVLSYEDWPKPEPKAQQLRIKTSLSSVNFADIMTRRGGYGQQSLPLIPGLDATGVVDAVGEAVSSFKVGDRVAAYTTGGSYADYVIAEEKLCFALPEAVGFEQASAIGILITAYNVLTLAGRFLEGESVLIHAAAGGVGSCLIQLAKGMGASKIYATVGSDEKADIARKLGADEVINYREQAFDTVINTLTNHKGVDLICDSIAGKTSEQGMNCLANFGRLIIFGHTSPEGAGEFNSQMLHKQNRGVIGYSSGGHRSARPEKIQSAAKAVLDLLAEGKIEVSIGGHFQLKDAAKAHELVESRRSVGKVLLEP